VAYNLTRCLQDKKKTLAFGSEQVSDMGRVVGKMC